MEPKRLLYNSLYDEECGDRNERSGVVKNLREMRAGVLEDSALVIADLSVAGLGVR